MGETKNTERQKDTDTKGQRADNRNPEQSQASTPIAISV